MASFPRLTCLRWKTTSITSRPTKPPRLFARRSLAKHPEVKHALDELAGKISDDDMRRLNYAVDGQHQDVAQVVKEFPGRGKEPLQADS